MKSLNFEIQNYHLLHQVGMPIFSWRALSKRGAMVKAAAL
jgi:hypothetical protein